MSVKDTYKLSILGHSYELKESPGLAGKRERVAECYCTGLTISIDSTFPASTQEAALLHEVIEALNFHMALNLEHDTLTRLAEGLYSVFKANPAFFICKGRAGK